MVFLRDINICAQISLEDFHYKNFLNSNDKEQEVSDELLNVV